MYITKDKMVALHYTVKIESGQVIDTSVGGKPFSYIHGIGNMIHGFEAALEGKQASDNLTFSVDPSEGYGERRSDLFFTVPREKLVGVQELELGMQFQIDTPQGQVPVCVLRVDEDTVELDGNHPLAGHMLIFDVSILDVRDAAGEELEEAYAWQAPSCGCSHHQDSCCECEPN